MKKRKSQWLRGEKSAVAKRCGIKPHHLTEILKGQRGTSLIMAQRLERASKLVHKERFISWVAWIRMVQL